MPFKVSIIIPVYNAEKYLIRCLKSVIAQTYENLECIIVEDNSQDNSAKIIKSFIDSYKGNVFFKVIQHEVNKGLSEARNKGTTHATGEYIFYLDADDEILPKCIDLLVEKAISYPNVDIVQGNTLLNHSEGFNNYDIQRYNVPRSFRNNEDIRNYFYDPWKSFLEPVWNKLIRTAFIRENDITFLKEVIHEDFHWFYKTINYIQSYVFVLEYTYIHYKVPNSITSTTNDMKSGKSIGIILCDLGRQIGKIDFERQFIKFISLLSRYYYKTPYVKELKDANIVYSNKAREHRWYGLFIILTLTRLISHNKYGNRLGASLTQRWVNHQRQCRKWGITPI